jgi:ethanolamine utilization microcompartment shell protein EutS
MFRAYPRHEIRAYGVGGMGTGAGMLCYEFETDGAGTNPTVTNGDDDMVLSNIYSAVGIYTITFKKRFSGALIHAQLSGGVVGDGVDVTTQTIGRFAPCTVVVTTKHDNAAAALNGPVVQLLMAVKP